MLIRKNLIQDIARLEENYDFNLETLEEKKKEYGKSDKI